MLVLLSQLLWAAFFVFILMWWRRPLAEGEYMESSASRALHLALVVAGFALMWMGHGTYQPKPAMMRTELLSVSGFVLQAAAMVFGVWARVTLGPNWTARVRAGGTQKLIVSGPYRMTRHPMYASLVVGAVGSALIVGRFRAYFGAVLIAVAYLRKIKLEEAALEQAFGDEYRQYEAFVPPILPTKGIDAVASTVKQQKEDAQRKQEQSEKAREEQKNDRGQQESGGKKSA